MLAKRIIPCLDVNDGRVVKGVNFVNLRDAGDPVELATFYSQQGADEIVFLDITATYEDRHTIVDVVRRTAQKVFVPLTVGGGIRTSDDFKELLRAGADKISVNSAAVKNKQLVADAAKKFGVSKSTVHTDVSQRLQQLNPCLYHEVRSVLDINKAQRHIRGGIATREKYKGKE